MGMALLLIDIQNDYFPGGKMELEGSVEAGIRAGEVLAFFRHKGMPLVHVQHLSARPEAGFFLPGSPGAEIHESVRPLPGETVIQKNFPNSFRGTPLLEHLRKDGVDALAVAGMMTQMCVDATARAAFDFGFKLTVIGDACAARALTFGGRTVPAADVQAAFLAALSGIYAGVASAREFIAGFR